MIVVARFSKECFNNVLQNFGEYEFAREISTKFGYEIFQKEHPKPNV